MKRVSVLSLLFLICAFSGCSNNVRINGNVTFDDGTPAPTGIVCFDSGSYIARGNIKSDGTFVMGSVKETDGLPPGNYKVFFIDVHKETGKSPTSDGSEGEPIYTSLIADKYDSPETSDLTAEVKADTKTLNFQLERNPNLTE